MRGKERNAALRAALASLQPGSSVGLTAAADLAEMRISLIGPAKPLRDVLKAAAWVPGASWVQPGEATNIRLERTNADLNRLAAEQGKQAREGRARLQQRWAQVERWAGLDSQGLNELARSEPDMASVLRDRCHQAMVRLAFGLPPNFRNSIFTGGTPRAPLAALPEAGQNLVTQAMLGNGRKRFDMEGFLRDGWLKLEVAGPPDRPTVWFDVGLPEGEGFASNLLYAEGWTRQPPAERRAQILARPTVAPRTALFRRKVTLRDPRGAGSARVAERPEGALSLLPLVEQVAEKTGATLLVQTDFQSRREDVEARKVDPKQLRRWLGIQWWLGEAIVDQPLAVALDLLCADFEYEWTTRGEVIVLRHRRWYLPEAERSNGKPKQPLFPRRERARPQP